MYYYRTRTKQHHVNPHDRRSGRPPRPKCAPPTPTPRWGRCTCTSHQIRNSRTRTPLMNTSTPHHTNTRLTDTRTHTPAMCAVCDTPPHPRTLCRDRTRRGSAEDLTSRERTHRHPHDFAAGGMIQYQNSIPRRPRVVACEASGRPPANAYPAASCVLLVLLPTPKVGRSFLRVLGVAILRAPVRAMIAASAPHMPRVRRRAFMGCRRCAAPCSFAPRRATRACWRR